MGTIVTKCSLQAALALTLLACSGMAGCSEGQEQNATNAGSSKAAVASTHTKTPNATAKATGTPTVIGTPSATASPTLIMTP